MTRSENDMVPNGFSRSEMERRWNELLGSIANEKLDGMVVTCPRHIEYLTGHDARGADMAPFYLLVAPDKPRMLVSRHMETPSIRREAIDLEIVSYFSDTDNATAALVKALRSIGLDRAQVGFELNNWGLTHGDVTAVEQSLSGLRITDASRILPAIVDVLSAEEIAAMRESVRMTDTAMRALFASLREGISEYDAESHAIQAVEAIADDNLTVVRGDFNTLFAQRTSLPHGTASRRQFLESGDAVTFECGLRYKGYVAGYCRSGVFRGRHKDAEALRQVSDDAISKGVESIRPGMTGRELDSIVRGVVEKAGRGACYRHRAAYAHGLCWNHRGSFTAHPESDMVVREHMVLFVTCFLYDEQERFGVVTSDPVLVTATGCEVLSGLPRDMIFV